MRILTTAELEYIILAIKRNIQKEFISDDLKDFKVLKDVHGFTEYDIQVRVEKIC